MTYVETQSFIEWCRSLGAIKVQVDGVAVEFVSRQAAAAPPTKPKSIDDDDHLSAEERRKREVEQRMFGSSL